MKTKIDIQNIVNIHNESTTYVKSHSSSSKVERKAFNFYRSYYDVFKQLEDVEKLQFIKALLERQFTGIEPNGLSQMANFAYVSQKHNIDAQVEGWENKTKRKLLSINSSNKIKSAI